MATQIKIIVTHVLPHFDEILTIWLLKKFGREQFPGVETAEIQYWGEKEIKTHPLEECGKQGILPIGICGGRFDEHPTLNSDRKEKECSSTLMAKLLGLDQDPILEAILKFALRSDMNAPNPFDLAFFVNLQNVQNPQNPHEVFDWTTKAIEAYYLMQQLFFTVVKEEFEKKALIEDLRLGAKIVKIVTIVSDDLQVAKFSRSRHGCEAAVTIQKNSKGNVQIFTNKRFFLNMSEVALIIRIEEQRLKGKIVTDDPEYLSREGTVEEAEEWYFHPGLQALLNGSLTKPDVEPTRIRLDQIRHLVKIGLNKELFYQNCDPRRCRNCPWNKWRLHRCRKLRFQTFHLNSQ